jgi:hypothetical protein
MGLSQMQVRSETIAYSKRKSRALKAEINQLNKTIADLEEQIDKTQDVRCIEQYEVAKSQLENLNRSKTNGVMIRSKARWIEQGEKSTKYFLSLEKHNYNKKNITKLTSDGVNFYTDKKGVLKCINEFYSKLYSEKTVGIQDQQRSEDTFINQAEVPKLDDTGKTELEEPISVLELGQALRELPNSKTPGSDGFSAEFYKFFWPDIKHLVHESLQYSFGKGELSIEQKRGVITLIPKEGKDHTNIKNWRPITLLNTDYKLLTKALAVRLQLCT